MDPQCSKYKVTKSVGVTNALKMILGIVQHHTSLDSFGRAFAQATPKDGKTFSTLCQEHGLILQKCKHLPQTVTQNASVITLENAGVYYKAGKEVATGND